MGFLLPPAIGARVAGRVRICRAIACCIAALTSRASRMRCSLILIRKRVAVVGAAA
jgi:hypothetical protein